MKRVLLINEGGLGNVGDEAIRRCMEHLLQSRGCSVEWTAFSRAATASGFRSRPPRCRRVWWKRALKALVPVELIWFTKHSRSYLPYLRSADFDLVIIGGGQLIQSNGVFALAMFLWVLVLKCVRRRRVVLVGVGVADGLTRLDRVMFRWLLRRVDRTYARDRVSGEVIRKLSGVSSESCPDVAFSVVDVIPATTQPLRRVLFCPADYAFYARKKGPDNHLMTEQQYWQYWVDRIESYASTGHDVRLFCTSWHQDFPFVSRLQEYLAKERGLAIDVDSAKDLATICQLIQSAEVVVAARMHALILAYSYAREVIAFPTSEKIEAFEEEYLRRKDGATTARLRIAEVVDGLMSFCGEECHGQ